MDAIIKYLLDPPHFGPGCSIPNGDVHWIIGNGLLIVFTFGPLLLLEWWQSRK